MNYAIIAAGKGSRLLRDGISLPKPLVEVAGEPMLGRLLRLFSCHDAESITVVINKDMSEVKQYLSDRRDDLPQLRVVEITTTGSLCSLRELTRALPAGKCCVTTVDAVFGEDEFARFIDAFARLDNEAHGLWAVTPWVDDEKPLWVTTSSRGFITAFLDDNTGGEARPVTGGLYGMTHAMYPVVERCMTAGLTRLRDFQRALLTAGFTLEAFNFDKIVDVDRAEDLDHARALLSQHDLSHSL